MKILIIIMLAIIVGITSACATLDISPKNAHGLRGAPLRHEHTKDGTLYVGMTQEEILALWGKPNSTIRMQGEFGVLETWRYEGWSTPYEVVLSDIYLFFENGKLAAWQS